MSADRSNRVALLTGATGFVGSHLVRRLCSDGWEVHIITRLSSDLYLVHEIVDRLTVHTQDGTTESMSAIVRSVRPAVVFHLASLYLAQHQAQDVAPLIQSNVLFGAQLLEAMAGEGIKHFINTGTAWQHYENRDYSPVNLYAATKQAFESILQFYVEATPLRAITLKLFDTFGPNDPRKKLFALLREAGRKSEPLLMSGGEQLLDLVHIDDVVEAFALAAARLQSGQVAGQERYAVSSGKPCRLKDIVHIYEEQTGQSLPIRWGERPYRSREVMVPWQSGQTLPGWRPVISLEQGLRGLIGGTAKATSV